MKNQIFNCTSPLTPLHKRGGVFSKANRSLFFFILLFLSLGSRAATINVAVGLPADTAGACRANGYSLTFNGVALGTRITITPALVYGTGTCSGTSTAAVYMDAASIPAGVTLDSTGSKFTFTLNNTGTVTLTYHCYVSCEVAGNNSISLNQVFSSIGNSFVINGNATATHITTGLQTPTITLLPQSNQYAANNANSYLTFRYVNTFKRAGLRFSFVPGNQTCAGVTRGSLFFKRGVNDTLRTYTGTVADTVTLFNSDTLYLLQEVSTSQCIGANACKDTAYFKWWCNYPAAVNANFCSDCKAVPASVYNINNNDSATVNVIRLQPSSNIYELSCFNDTANATEWSYAIVHNGIGVMDSLNFDLTILGSNPQDMNYLSLIDKKNIFFGRNAGSTFVIDTTYTLKTAWLCTGLVSQALHSCKVKLLDFAPGDTLYVKFKTLRCAEDAAVLNNKSKLYNRWRFLNFYSKDICNNAKDQKGGGLYNNTTAISAQATSGTFYDLDLKLNYYPSVSNLSVSNQGVGDTAVLTMDLNSLVVNNNIYVYQLLGCTDVQQQCDTLHGWLRTTIEIDTNLRIKNPAADVFLFAVDNNNDTTKINSKYYYTDKYIGDSVCRKTTYYLYFNVADTGMRRVFEKGKLSFEVEACCGANIAFTNYDIRFHLLPDPENCYVLNLPTDPQHITAPTVTPSNVMKWLPLSSKQDKATVLCPGCKSPGFLSDFYTMRRTSLGLQDSDNDGYADSTTAQIKENSPWYNQYGILLNRNFSGFGDRVEDLLKGYFVDGDPGNGGYNYQQLTQRGLRFNVLQLSRVIPMGLDTMKLTPDSIIFYVDDTLNSSNGCLDCQPYGMGTSDYTTRIKVVATGADVAKYLVNTSVNANEYRFAFTTFHDTVNNTYSGNLHDYPALITTPNPGNPFTGFTPYQVCRLRVVYNVCGNYQIASNNLQFDQVVKQSTIRNNFFFSGKVRNLLGDNIAQQPNTEEKLELVNYTVYTDSVGGTIQMVDTTFMNTYRFYCENTGANHYFVSTRLDNGSQTLNTAGCNKQLNVEAVSSIAGGKGIFDAYPYEYKVPLLQAVNYNLTIPQGYAVQQAAVQNSFVVNGQAVFSDTVGVLLPATQGNVVFNATALPPLTCLAENNTAAGNDTLFAGDQNNRYLLKLTLAPTGCADTLTQPLVSNTATLAFNVRPICELNPATCGTANNDTLRPNGVLSKLGNPVKLVYTYTGAAEVPLGSDTICFNGLTFLNKDSGQVNTGMAEHLFIALLSTPTYLTNWFFASGIDTTHATQNVLGIKDALPIGIALNGNLCARVTGCPNDSLPVGINLHYGWNCNDYPVPYDSSTVCHYQRTTLTFKKELADLQNQQKFHRASYTLCDTVSVWAPFTSTQQGYVYPDSVVLQHLHPALEVVGGYIANGGAFSTNTAQLTPTGNNAVWLVNVDSLRHIQFNEGGLHAGENLFVRFLVRPTCNYLDGGVLPDMALYAHDFCGVQLSDTSIYSGSGPFIWDGHSKCNDCWSINKTVNMDTVPTGSNLTYTITVCNNSDTTQTATLTDVTPAGWVQTGGALPASVTLGSTLCATYTLTGHYTTAGNCNSHYNVATVTSPANTPWRDSVCVTVVAPQLLPCATDTTIFWSSKQSITLAPGFVNKAIIVTDSLIVNDSLYLGGCRVTTYAGAKIIITATGKLVLNTTVIEGCDSMWRGVYMNVSGKMWMNEQSRISDADVAIFANDKCELTALNSALKNNVNNIFVPQKSSGNNTVIQLDGMTIGMFANAFKPNYIGQASHQAIPKAGVDVRDINLTIDPMVTNYFYNMTVGISALRSDLIVSNCLFRVMDPTYVNGFSNYRGSAIGMEGDPVKRLGSLQVLDMGHGSIQVDTCLFGIHCTYSDLYVSTAYINAAVRSGWAANTPTIGIYANKCLAMVQLFTNNIKANQTGINLFQCQDASYVEAGWNTIKINGAGLGSSKANGILIDQKPNTATGLYKIWHNANIEVANGMGINCKNTKNAEVTDNYIKLNYPGGAGINLELTDTSFFSCNTIRGVYPFLPDTSKGITAFFSPRNTFTCNYVDSTKKGIEFRGNCDKTNLQGNVMNRHYVGLYLDGAALIGKQPFNSAPPYNGNIWQSNSNYSSGFGAVNMNSLQPGDVLNNLFTTNQNVTTHNPVVPLTSVFPFYRDNSGWFNKLPAGTAFSCQSNNSSVCANITFAQGEEGMRQAIAEGDEVSAVFKDESKAIAAQNLYAELKEKPSLINGNAVLQDFVTDNENAAIGKIYEAKKEIAKIDALDGTEKNAFSTALLQAKTTAESIKQLDVLLKNDASAANMQQRELLIGILSAAYEVGGDVISQQDAQGLANITNATAANAAVVTGEQPLENERIVNEIQLDYEQNGVIALQNRYAELLNIANDCPLAGGPAVFKARHFVAIVDASVTYYDETYCEQLGFLRKAGTDNTTYKNKVQVIPNPASKKVDIVLQDVSDGICNITISNSQGIDIYKSHFDCRLRKFTIFTHEFSSGIYTIEVMPASEVNEKIKLVIIR